MRLCWALQQGQLAGSLAPSSSTHGSSAQLVQRVVEMASDVARGLAALHAGGCAHGSVQSCSVVLPAGDWEPGSCAPARALLMCPVGQALVPPALQQCNDQAKRSWSCEPWSACPLPTASAAAHVAPELHEGGSATQAGDVYAFGAFLYELHSGMRAYQGLGVSFLRHVRHAGLRPVFPPSCPPAWKALALRCMDACPAARPPMWRVAEELELLQGVAHLWPEWPALSESGSSGRMAEPAAAGVGPTDPFDFLAADFPPARAPQLHLSTAFSVPSPSSSHPGSDSPSTPHSHATSPYGPPSPTPRKPPLRLTDLATPGHSSSGRQRRSSRLANMSSGPLLGPQPAGSDACGQPPLSPLSRRLQGSNLLASELGGKQGVLGCTFDAETEELGQMLGVAAASVRASFELACMEASAAHVPPPHSPPRSTLRGAAILRGVHQVLHAPVLPSHAGSAPNTPRHGLFGTSGAGSTARAIGRGGRRCSAPEPPLIWEFDLDIIDSSEHNVMVGSTGGRQHGAAQSPEPHGPPPCQGLAAASCPEYGGSGQQLGLIQCRSLASFSSQSEPQAGSTCSVRVADDTAGAERSGTCGRHVAQAATAHAPIVDQSGRSSAGRRGSSPTGSWTMGSIMEMLHVGRGRGASRSDAR